MKIRGDNDTADFGKDFDFLDSKNSNKGLLDLGSAGKFIIWFKLIIIEKYMCGSERGVS